MKTSNAKENILTKIKQALNKPVPVPFPQSEGNSNVYTPIVQDADLAFAENFTSLQGRFAYCADNKELAAQLHALLTARKWDKVYCKETGIKETLSAAGLDIPYFQNLAGCDVSITGCEFLVARTGTIVMSSGQSSGRATSVYAPIHICIAYTNQLVNDIKDALLGIKDSYSKIPSLITFATGPSRTADIEKTLVVGVHGPKEVFCFLVEG